MLINGAKSAKGNRALAVLTQTFSPELRIPRTEEFQLVGLGHQYIGAGATVAIEPDGDGSP